MSLVTLEKKQYQPGLVKDNIWRFSRNINYFGDILRYLSFSVVAGSIWAYLVPAYQDQKGNFGYRRKVIFLPNESINLPCFPEITLDLSKVFPKVTNQH